MIVCYCSGCGQVLALIPVRPNAKRPNTIRSKLATLATLEVKLYCYRCGRLVEVKATKFEFKPARELERVLGGGRL
jgi:hypothetical protein